MGMVKLCDRCPNKYKMECGIGHEKYGEGEPQLIFVGESPGAEEAERMRPFVGMFGGLLRNMIRAYNVDKVPYVLTNLTYCVPDNRYESNVALAICRDRTTDILKAYPNAKIVALGSVPAHLIGGVSHITQHDGVWVRHDGRDVLTLSIQFLNNVHAFPNFELGFSKAFKPVELPYIPDIPYTLIPYSSTQLALELLSWEQATGDVVIDIETTDKVYWKGELTALGVGINDKFYIYGGRDWSGGLTTILRTIFNNPNIRLGFHNGGNFDVVYLMHHYGVPYRLDWDTLLMHYSLKEKGLATFTTKDKDADSKGHGLKKLGQAYLNIANYAEGIDYVPKTEQDWVDLYKYLAIDLWLTLELKKTFDKMIQEGL